MELVLPNSSDVAFIDDEDAHLVSGRTFYLGRNGYAYYSIWSDGKSRPHTLHQLIMGNHPGMHIDHINRNKLDNRKKNLRVVTPQINQVNREPKKNRGVTFRKKAKTNPWIAQIMVNRKQIHLGKYSSLNEAVAARVAGEIKYFGMECPR